MIRRPPRSTRTDTLFPYTTLFRSLDQCELGVVVQPFDSCIREFEANAGGRTGRGVSSQMIQPIAFLDDLVECRCIGVRKCNECVQTAQLLRPSPRENIRAEAGRVGKEWVRTWRTRWAPTH